MNKSIFIGLVVIFTSSIFVGCTTIEPPVLAQLKQQKQRSTKSRKSTSKKETGIPMSKPASQSTTSIPVTSAGPTSSTNRTSKKSSLITLGPKDDLLSLIEEAPGKVLIDFYADWCGPCRKQGAILREMKNIASTKKVRIIKINVDDHRDLAETFRVAALPTLVVVKDKKIVDRHLGLANQRKIESLISN